MDAARDVVTFRLRRFRHELLILDDIGYMRARRFIERGRRRRYFYIGKIRPVTSVFNLMDEIEKRPDLFVGYTRMDRAAQMRNLEFLLIGYGLAVQRHGIDDPGRISFAYSRNTYQITMVGVCRVAL